ncbi:MAG TPA: ParB/RepB/Spo0J family partition protein [Burkholderiaceae bacterium]|nr:ParB/RepB/Spo0J family partition protein [Burkholderiaceae bacterium]
MRFPWQKTESEQQLDLLGDTPAPEVSVVASRAKTKPLLPPTSGIPRMVLISQIDEDPANPRTEFPDAKVDELADDLRQRGILEALVVHPANAQGRYLLHFGAMRLRAAIRAGLHEVPAVIRDAPADRYAQVAENLKRHSLSSLDLARFVRDQVNSGESQTTIAKQLGMNLTTVAHHLSLLELPPALDVAMRAGRCTSPRTLHELSKLHEQRPEQVKALVDGPGDITREAVATLRERVDWRAASSSTRLVSQAVTACDRLEKLLGRIDQLALDASGANLAVLRAKVAALSSWSPPGSDRQTP